MAFASADSCMITLAALTTWHSLMPQCNPPDNYDSVLVLNTCQCFLSTQGGIVIRPMLCLFTLQQKWERGGVVSAISDIHLSVCANISQRFLWKSTGRS